MREAALRKKASCYWAAEKEQKKLDGGDGGSIRMVEMVLYQPFSVTLEEHVLTWPVLKDGARHGAAASTSICFKCVLASS